METSAFAPAAANAGAGPSSSASASAPVPGSSVENIQNSRVPNEIPPRTSSQYRVMDRPPKSFLKAPHETDWISQKRRPTTAAPALASQSTNEVKPSKHTKHSSLPLNNMNAAKQQQEPHNAYAQQNHRHYNYEPNHHHNSSNHDFYLLKNKGIGSQVNGSGYQSDIDFDRHQSHQRRQHHHNHQRHQQLEGDDLYSSERRHPGLQQPDLSPPPKEPFREIVADQIYRQNPEWTREKDKVVLAPYEYLLVHPGKDIRSRSIVAFNAFLKVPDESLKVIKRVVGMLHTASLLIDDVEDSSVLRRGVPVAHSIFGIPQTINSANYVYFLALKELSLLRNVTEAIGIYTDELVNLHRGQGMDLFWRDTLTCPSEADYLEMVGNKTGGLFRLAVKLMQVESATDIDCVPLVNTIGLLFQIHDDYQNLHPSSAQSLSKGTTCEDLTEGKFSFPIIHAIRADPASHLLQNILRQRTADPDVKRYAVDYLERVGSFAYTRRVLRDLSRRAMALIDELEGRVEGSAERGPFSDIHQKGDVVEGNTVLRDGLDDANVSPLPLEIGNHKHSSSNSNNNNNNNKNTADNNNNSGSSNGRKKHVRIGHGVRQILEKLKVDMPKPTATNTTNTTNTTGATAAAAANAAATTTTTTAGGNSSTTQATGSGSGSGSGSGVNGLELGSQSRPGPVDSPPQSLPSESKNTQTQTQTQTQTPMPLASSPSTPMAMTELPAAPSSRTDAVDGDGERGMD